MVLAGAAPAGKIGVDGHLELVGMSGAFARGSVGVYERPQVAERATDVAEHHRPVQAAGTCMRAALDQVADLRAGRRA